MTADDQWGARAEVDYAAASGLDASQVREAIGRWANSRYGSAFPAPVVLPPDATVKGWIARWVGVPLIGLGLPALTVTIREAVGRTYLAGVPPIEEPPTFLDFDALANEADPA